MTKQQIELFKGIVKDMKMGNPAAVDKFMPEELIEACGSYYACLKLLKKYG